MIDFILIPNERIKFLKKTNWGEKLKKFSDVKVNINEEISIESEDPFQVMRVKEVFKAVGRGFNFDDALSLLDEEYVLETIELKEFAGKSRDRQVVLKSRVIGTSGKTKKIIEKDTETKIAVYGKTISIIGKWNNVPLAKEAIEMLLSGSMHNTVYRFLEMRKK